MATATSSLAPDNSTDAGFRLWGKGISDQLAAMGLVQATGVGTQIDWTTVTHPTATNSSKGYEVWKLADTLQSTTPVFVKIEYGSGGAASGVNPNLWITVGFACDGTGAITGTQLLARTSITQTNNTAANSTSTFTCAFSGSTNRFTMGMFLNNSVSTTGTFWFAIERSKDTSGADTATGVIIGMGYGVGNATRVAWQYLPASGGVPPSGNLLPAIISNSGSGAFGANVGLGVPIPLAGAAQNPGLNLQCGTATDFPSLGTTISPTVYGALHTYYNLGPNLAAQIGVGAPTAGAATRVFILYE